MASPIVVGVSPVTGSRAALQWAVQEARVRRGRVRAVMAWRGSGLPGGAPGRAPAQSIIDSVPEQRRAEESLGEFVAEALGDDHDVELRAVEGKAQVVLLEEAEEAALLVIDSPALAKLYDPSARRLAPRVIFRSPCPVVVMPPADPEADADLDDFVGEYARGRTPIPCVRCNTFTKFRDLVRKADSVSVAHWIAYGVPAGTPPRWRGCVTARSRPRRSAGGGRRPGLTAVPGRRRQRRWCRPSARRPASASRP